MAENGSGESGDDKAEPGKERRKNEERRDPNSDRRGEDRVVSEMNPRRQKDDRRDKDD